MGKSNQPRKTPKPGHRMPGGTYVDTSKTWDHFIDIDDPTTGTTPTETTSTTPDTPAPSGD